MAFPSFLKIFHFNIIFEYYISFQDILWSYCFLTSSLESLFTQSFCTWTGILKISLSNAMDVYAVKVNTDIPPLSITYVNYFSFLCVWVVNYWEITMGNKCVSVNSPLKVKVISLFITQCFFAVLPLFTWCRRMNFHIFYLNVAWGSERFLLTLLSFEQFLHSDFT